MTECFACVFKLTRLFPLNCFLLLAFFYVETFPPFQFYDYFIIYFDCCRFKHTHTHTHNTKSLVCTFVLGCCCLIELKWFVIIQCVMCWCTSIKSIKNNNFFDGSNLWSWLHRLSLAFCVWLYLNLNFYFIVWLMLMDGIIFFALQSYDERCFDTLSYQLKIDAGECSKLNTQNEMHFENCLTLFSLVEIRCFQANIQKKCTIWIRDAVFVEDGVANRVCSMCKEMRNLAYSFLFYL